MPTSCLACEQSGRSPRAVARRHERSSAILKSILFKALGDASTGLGHVSRLSSLIDALPPGWTGVFHVSDDPLVKRFLADRGIAFECGDALQLLRSRRFDRLIYDELVLEEAFLLEARARGIPLLGALDFFHYARPLVDVIVNLFNQNPSAGGPPPSSGVRYYEGLEYAIVSARFRGARTPRQAAISRVLVMFGGADQNGLTTRALSFLESVTPRLAIDVVVGPLNRRRADIAAAAKASRHDVRTFENPTDLPRIMGRADVAFTACGTTCFELGYLGVPSIVVPQNAEERRLAEAMQAQGIVLTGEDLQSSWQSLGEPRRRSEMSAAALNIFDGRGAQRILGCFDIS